MDVVIVLGSSSVLPGGSKKITERNFSFCRLMKAIEVYNDIKNPEKMILYIKIFHLCSHLLES